MQIIQIIRLPTGNISYIMQTQERICPEISSLRLEHEEKCGSVMCPTCEAECCRAARACRANNSLHWCCTAAVVQALNVVDPVYQVVNMISIHRWLL